MNYLIFLKKLCSEIDKEIIMQNFIYLTFDNGLEVRLKESWPNYEFTIVKSLRYDSITPDYTIVINNKFSIALEDIKFENNCIDEIIGIVGEKILEIENR